jgi:hypothetical protein
MRSTKPTPDTLDGPCPWLFVCLLVGAGAVLAGGTFAINCWRLGTLRYAGPLDLAYYNQQLWNAWHGNAPITLRPRNSYVTEGPQPWRTNHLRPITVPIGLVYGIWPGIPMLFAVQSLMLGAGVWPAFRLGQQLAGDPRCGVVAGGLYASSAIVWLLGTNDFRYLHLGVPLVLALADAMERRVAGRAVLWALVLFSTRESYCIVVAGLGLRQWVRRDRPWRENAWWAAAAVAGGVAWFWVHVVWLWWAFGGESAAGYLRATRDPVAAYGRNPGAMLDDLSRSARPLGVVGGPLAALGVVAPEFALPGLALGYPPLRMGLFTLHPAQHYTRYLAPAGTVLLLAALAGFARLWRRCDTRGKRVLAFVCMLGFAASTIDCVVLGRDAVLKLPSRLGTDPEVKRIGRILAEIPNGDPVLAFRSALPALANRSELFDYYQLPPGVSIDDALSRSRWVLLEPHLRVLGELAGQRPAPVVQSQLDFIAATQSDGGLTGAELLQIARRLTAQLGRNEFERVAQLERIVVWRRRDH